MLENSEVTIYDDTKHNKQILIVTDSARLTLVDFISEVLNVQLFSVIFIMLMIGSLFLVNHNWKEKTYIAANKSGLSNQFNNKNKPGKQD